MRIQDVCYGSIEELPLDNWIKVTEESKIEYVCRDITKVVPGPVMEQAWESIYDDYLKRYGLTKMYKRLLEVKKRKALLELDYVITKDKFNLTLIEMEERNIEQMLNNKGVGVSIRTALVYLGKWVGYRLDPREMSTLEYFTLMDLYGKENTKERDSRR